ncbi:MAG: FG-GAP repeat protein [Candidatus Binatia bacterium]
MNADCLAGETCQTKSWLQCDQQQKDIAIGDFDGDGWMDVVIARKKPFSRKGGRSTLC